MVKIITVIVAWALAGAFARVITGAGLAVFVYKGLDRLANPLVSGISSAMSGLPADLAGFLGLLGLGQAISIIVSTGISIFAIKAAARAVGIKLSGS